jgi:hypothetical protein
VRLVVTRRVLRQGQGQEQEQAEVQIKRRRRRRERRQTSFSCTNTSVTAQKALSTHMRPGAAARFLLLPMLQGHCGSERERTRMRKERKERSVYSGYEAQQLARKE